MYYLFNRLIFLLFILCSLSVNGQEVKLGMPLGHRNLLNDAIFSPDDKLIVTVSDDNSAIIWDVESGKLIHTLSGHSEKIVSIEFSPDGKRVLTGSWDNTACLWETSSGKLLHSLEGHTRLVASAKFSKTGDKIVTSSYDNTAKLWDSNSGMLLLTFKGHASEVNYAEFSPDGLNIVTASSDKSVRVWNTSNGKQLKSMIAHSSAVEFAKYSTDGFLIVTTAAYDPVIRVWNSKKGKLMAELAGHTKEINYFDFSPCGNYVVSASDDHTAILWDLHNSQLITSLKGHSNWVTRAKFSPDGKTIVTVADDTRIWDSKTGCQIQYIEGLVRSATFNHAGNCLITIYDFVTQWDVISGERINSTVSSERFDFAFANFTTDNQNIIIVQNEIYFSDILSGQSKYFSNEISGCLDMSSDGLLFRTECYLDSIVSFWEGNSGKLIMTTRLEDFDAFNNDLKSCELSNDGKRIISASNNGSAQIWEVSSGKFLFNLISNSGQLNYAEFSKKGNRIVTVSNGGIEIWDGYNGERLNTLDVEGWLNLAHFSPNGDKLLTSSDSILQLWNTESGALIYSLNGHSSNVTSARFSPDGKKILSNSSTEGALIWDVESGLLLNILNGHKRNITSIEFSPEGNHILLGSADHNASVWDCNSGKMIFKLQGHTNVVTSAKYSINGERIVTSSLDGAIILWNAQTGKQLIRQFIFDSDPYKWVHLHPSGLFDASPEAMELMYWTKGLEVIEFAQLKDRYWVPGLWEKVMKGEPIPDVRDMQELKLQPEVEVGEMKDGKIPVTLTKREGGYGKVSILINGKEVQADARGANFDKTKETQTVWVDLKDHPNLQDGENKIAVKASSEDGFVQGRPVEKVVKVSIQRSKPHFYAVVVGTGKFTNSAINLKYPEKDAQSIRTALQLGAEQLFDIEHTHVYTLTTASGERPTKAKIKSIFSEIAGKATSSDVIVVYLSGHGIAWGGDQGDFYYLTTDVTAANAEAFNDEVLRKNYTISTSEFTEYLKAIPANKQVMIIDACSSGKAVENLMASRDIDGSQLKAIDRMKDRTGMFVISGSAADAVSYEASRYGQGLLTYSILQAMKGAALREGQFFDVNTILNYSRENVPKLAAGIGGIQTPQLLIPKGGSFDIGSVNDSARAQIPLSNVKPVFVRTTFVDAESFSDDLNLSKSLDEKLNEIAMRGSDGQLVFLDTREFPDAYRLSGGYTQSNGVIKLKLKIKGPTESEHIIVTKSIEEIIEKIIEKIGLIVYDLK